MNDNLHLRKILLRLPNTGKEFEEIVACALERFLDQRVWRARSGSQHGADMGTSGDHRALIRLEAKRYDEQTTFDERELLGEIGQAMQAHPELDLWILATCAEVPEQIERALSREADTRAIGIEILDLSASEQSKLPRLLAWAAEDVVTLAKKYLDESTVTELHTLLKALRANYGTNQKLQDDLIRENNLIRRISQRAQACIRDLGQNSAQSRKHLGQEVHGTDFVQRQAATEALDHWYTRERFHLLAFLGEEGTGKTWAVYTWIETKCEDGDFLPIIIPASRAGSMENIEAEIARQLANLFKDNDSGRWQKRVNRWIKSPRIQDRLIIVFDGLNEHPTVKWRTIIDQLVEDAPEAASLGEGSGSRAVTRFPIIVTCRTGYWNQLFAHLDLWKRTTFTLEPFSNEELSEYLNRHGRRPDEFRRDVWDLLRVPRYCDCVVKHYDRIADDGDITRDRLLYEDWRDRYRRKSQLPMTDHRFQSLLRDLAEQALQNRTHFRESEIQVFLPVQETERVLVELKTGGIFRATSSGKTEVQPERLHHALGLLLLDELVESQERSPEELEEIIAKYLEPSGIDAHAAICAAAIFGCTRSQQKVSAAIITTLFRKFFSLQNIGDDQWERVSAYFPVFPEIYRSLAETLVSESTAPEKPWDVVKWAYHRWCDDKRLRPTIVEHCTEWLRTIPLEWPWGQDAHNNQQQYQKKLRELFGEDVDISTEGTHGSRGVELRIVDWKQLSRLHFLALDLLSAKPTEVTPELLRTWVFSTTVQSFPGRYRIVWWMVKFLAPEKRAALVGEIENMLQVDNPIWQEAAYHLAFLLPDARAEELQDQSTYKPQDYRQERYEEDKCSLPIWNDEDCADCLGRHDIKPWTKAHNLAQHAFKPAFEVAEDIASSVQASMTVLLGNIDQAEPDQEEVIPSDWQLERSKAAFARWVPAEYAAFSTRLVAAIAHFDLGLSDTEDKAERRRCRLERKVRELESLLLVLDSTDLADLRTFWERWNSQAPENRKNRTVTGDVDYLEATLFRILLSASDPRYKTTLILQRPADAANLSRIDNALPLLLTNEGVEDLRSSLSGRSDDEFFAKSVLLCREAPLWSDEQRTRLLRVAKQKGSEEWRILAIIALLSEDQVLIRQMLQSEQGLPYRFVVRRYSISSDLLPDDVPIEILEKSIPTILLSHVLDQSQEQAHFRRLAELLREHVAEGKKNWLLSFGFDGHPARTWTVFSKTAVARALEADPTCLDDLLRLLEEPAATSPAKHSFRLYCAVCHYLLEHSRKQAPMVIDRLIQAWYEENNQVFHAHAVLTLLAPWASREEVGSRLLDCLDLCLTDTSLQSFALSFVDGDQEWLWRRIEADLSSNRAILKARALTLAGFLCDTDRSIPFLEDAAKRTGWWLDSVRKAALGSARKALWAKHWFREFLRREDATDSWAAFQLFLDVVDRRYYTWVTRELEAHGFTERDGSTKMRHLLANMESVRRKIDDREKKELKKTFCHSEIVEDSFPWTKQWKLAIEHTRAFFRD